ncbi:hypothetical protein E0H80_00450 [Acinetobacter sp. ANC 4779]|uniref:hypothetical protein n=1 Tax=Acinetobacter sp. ANC 4779 TaxID=2529848 RepID=UPI0010409D09|nr:hypothetical protein [Acinetobacter sp. ANC 4779]TCB52378.1 hypothetical protein E0H80_00450 [Acinetobacter sp. ANC 4779]
MKKLSTIFTAAIFTMLSATAFACPKGTTMMGGTGPNHKGGKCVATTHIPKNKANHMKKAEPQMMKSDQNMMKMDKKSATSAPATTAPQTNMHENMNDNKTPEKQAPQP